MLPMILVTLGAAATAAFGDVKIRTFIPYEEMKFPMKTVPSRNIEGVDCTPFFLKHTKEGTKLDPEAAKFRIETADGKTVILKWETLASIKEADRTVFVKKQIQDGFTHRLWIPKVPKKYARAKIVWNLCPQSVEFEWGKEVPLEVQPNPPGD
ncbi:MAG: hypothetical protein AB8D78_06215 [Akkermansiaceae bacterium]